MWYNLIIIFCRHPERPERIIKIKEHLQEYKLIDRMSQVNSRIATTDELCLVHTWKHVNMVRKTSTHTKELRQLSDKYNSVYFNPSTYSSAILAAGSTLEVMSKVLNGDYQSGICVVRPPGHHAEAEEPHGFCIFNNVALAAQDAIKNHGLKRWVSICNKCCFVDEVLEQLNNKYIIHLQCIDCGLGYTSRQWYSTGVWINIKGSLHFSTSLWSWKFLPALRRCRRYPNWLWPRQRIYG